MSKICKNCSNVLEDDAVFCGNCGAMYEEPAAPAEETAAASAEKAVAENVPAWKALLNKVMAKLNVVLVKLKLDKVDPKKLIIGAAAAVAVLVLAIVLLAGSGVRTAVRNYQKALNGKAEVIEKLAPKDYWDYVEDEYELSLDDVIEEYEDTYDSMVEDWEEDYGDNVRIKLKITDKEKVKASVLKKIARALADKYDFINKKDVKKAFEIELEMSIKGSDDEDDEDTDLYAIKIGGKWYLASCYKYSGEYYATLLIDSLV